jgi:hypothetical protein
MIADLRCDWAACTRRAVRIVDGWRHCGHHLAAHMAEFRPHELPTRAPTPAEKRLLDRKQQQEDWQLAEAILNAGYRGYTRAELTGPSQLRDLVRARQELMVALHDELGMSLSDVGRLFHRDHTTVIHARGRVRQQPEQEAS